MPPLRTLPRPRTASAGGGCGSRPGWRLLLLVAALASLPVARSPATAAPVDAPDALGPFAVGRTTFAATDLARDRSLFVDAWYPVDAVDADAAPSVYGLIFDLGVTSEVALDGPPVSSAGPFPLVVFSHGSGGVRFQSYFLCETLASHGFLVVAPDHAGNTAFDVLFGTSQPFSEVALDRPADVSFLIDHLLERSADPGDSFAGAVDAARIAVVGHSFGGFTALAVASGFATVPPDPRLDAIVPLSPASSILSDEDLDAIDVPTLIVGGSSDVTTPIDPESARPYALIPARPRYRVDIERAGHNSFTDICSIADALLGVGLPADIVEFVLGTLEEGCAPGLLPFQEVHRLTNLYVVAFLKRHLSGDPRYQRYLNEGRVRSLGLSVDFFRTAGKGR